MFETICTHAIWEFNRKYSQPIRTQQHFDTGHRPLVIKFEIFEFRFEIYTYKYVKTAIFVQIERKNISANQSAA